MLKVVHLLQLATLPRDELASMWQAYTDDMASCMCLLHAAAGTSAAKRCADATLGRGDGSTASRLVSTDTSIYRY